ncbi:MAG TPA: hypothetical protein VFH73_10375 [Polyangia bacterium]|jgi:hypothetical protein|nr:hypothetical protein [Polyangia bacterium]
MPGTSVSPCHFNRPWLVTCALVFAFAVGGVACKQGINERCERDEDCADPDVNYCAMVNRTTLNEGSCQPRSTMSTMFDAGMGTDAGAERGEPVEGGAEASADSAIETHVDLPPAGDGAAETAETAPVDAPADVPAAEVAPEVTADLAGEAG